jgi:hypothetical protein
MPNYPNGKLVERVKAYNAQALAAGFLKDCHTLRPIPQTEIDRSTSGMKQNPCY